MDPNAPGIAWDPMAGQPGLVRLGSQVYISPTRGVNHAGKLVAESDAYAQALQALRNIEFALQQIGASRTYIVKLRMRVANMSDSDAVNRAYAEFFTKPRPSNTIVEVDTLFPGTLVEIEADAVLNA